MIPELPRAFRIAVLSIALLSPVCRAAEAPASPRIIDGTLVPESQFPTVGRFGSEGNPSLCTGTLIAPRFVLMAAHCLNNQTAGSLGLGQTEGIFTLGGKRYASRHLYVHPTYVGNSSQQQEGAIDFALVELQKALRKPAPSPLYRQVPTVGTLVTLVGYGRLGTGFGGATSDVPPKGQVAVGTTPIDIVTGTFIKWNFDDVPAPNQESNTAPGDSGGPEFITEGGVMYLAAATSGGVKNNASFGDLSYNTRVDIATDWIDSFTGGPAVAKNHAPVIVAVDAERGVTSGAPFTFAATASDKDGDVLHCHWIFGDGTEILDGNPTESHTFAAEGDYLVQLVVNDQKGGSVGRAIPVAVLSATPPPSTLIPATFLKKKFAVGFAENKSDGALDITIASPDFQFPDQAAFEAVFTPTVLIEVYVGNDLVDVVFGIDGKTKQQTTKFDYKKGTFHYSIKGKPQLTPALNLHGAVDATVKTTLTVPISVEFDTDVFHAGAIFRYGGDATFAYAGKRGKSGKGK